ncbi:MAG: hypothetical protein P1U42_09775 [Phycisphaerales bacterium]|nr:hypothetical protein [Phycisphaerales bacterium]
MSTIESPTKPSDIIQSIRSMIVLYGSVRSTPLARRIDRSLLDLPLVSGSITSHHMANAQACARRFDLQNLEMRVLVDTESRPPTNLGKTDLVNCVVQEDASPIRGVAGVLSDATKEMADDDYIIVSSGAQVFLEPLSDLVHAMAKKTADVSFVSCMDGAPVGVWLIRCGVLKSVNNIGYVDLKEQSLEAWKMEHKVSVVERHRAYAHPTRSLAEYLNAIRAETAGFGSGATIDEDPYREEWESTFSIVEPDANVADDVILHDSIALKGATVGKGAVVVRSILCPGSVVMPGARVIDKVLTGTVKKARS